MFLQIMVRELIFVMTVVIDWKQNFMKVISKQQEHQDTWIQ